MDDGIVDTSPAILASLGDIAEIGFILGEDVQCKGLLLVCQQGIYFVKFPAGQHRKILYLPERQFLEFYPAHSAVEKFFLATEELHRLNGGRWKDFSVRDEEIISSPAL